MLLSAPQLCGLGLGIVHPSSIHGVVFDLESFISVSPMKDLRFRTLETHSVYDWKIFDTSLELFLFIEKGSGPLMSQPRVRYRTL
jgi:hypothetical protein